MPGSLFPGVVPWLAILGLLLLRRNREAAAWWVLLPLICSYAFQPLLRSLLSTFLNQPWDWFEIAAKALAFGVAAAWLVSGYLAWRHRFLAFLGQFLFMAGFGALALACTIDWDTDFELPVTATMLGISSLAVSLALTFAGLLCRRQYRPVRLSICIVLGLLVFSFLITAPIFVFAMIASGQPAIWEFVSGILTLVIICVGVLAPFVVLSFASEFYRERLTGLLKIGQPEPPPVLGARPAEALAGAGPQLR